MNKICPKCKGTRKIVGMGFMTTACDNCAGKGYIEIATLTKPEIVENTILPKKPFERLDDKTKAVLISHGIGSNDALMKFDDEKLVMLKGIGEKRAEEIKALKRG